MNNLGLKSFSESVGKTMGVAAMRSGFALKALTAAFLVLGGATACGTDMEVNGPVAAWNDAGNDGSGKIDGNTRRNEADAGSDEPDAGGDGGPDPEDTANAVKKLITVACPSFQKSIDDALKNIDGGCPLNDKEIKNLDKDLLSAAKAHIDAFMSDLNSGKYKLYFNNGGPDDPYLEASLSDNKGYSNDLYVNAGNNEPGSGMISLSNGKLKIFFRRAGGGDGVPYQTAFSDIYCEDGYITQKAKCPEDKYDPFRRLSLSLVGEQGGDGGDVGWDSLQHIGVTSRLVGSYNLFPYSDNAKFDCGYTAGKSAVCHEKDGYNHHGVKVECADGVQITIKKGMSIEGSNSLANKILALLKPLIEAVASKQTKTNDWKTIDFEIKNP